MSPQQTIAHYRILSKLGEGGMGAVYRATDTKLNRDVAIKVIPDSFAQDPDRMARFAREAQVLASLNHPNIAAIYGVEERALVLELVEGPTLAERIAAGAIPLEEALPIARQITEALEYAHERGVVHRDLKPANIKVTPEGRVKVLDFGLAKAFSNETSAADPVNSPTLTMRATALGVIMGTAAYMSPEQAKGKPVDRRADIWAFGVVLLEMLTGRQLYTGETVSETLAAVIMKEPDLSGLPAATSAAIRNLLRRCLQKDPLRRLRDIGEARIAIEEAPIAEVPGPAAPGTLTPSRRGMPPWAVAVPAVAALVLAGFLWRATRPVDRPMMRFSADLGPDAIRSNQVTAAISPDGARLVYSVRGAGDTSHLATRRLDQSTASVLAGTEGAILPFFSPDSQWIGFFADQKMKKISVQGGAAVKLCDVPSQSRGAAWGEDGNIIATLDNVHLFRVPEAGGKPEIVTKPEDRGERTNRWPQLLPGGQTLLFTARGSGVTDFEDAFIGVLSLKTGQVKTVQRGGYFGRYLPSGHLTYVHQGTLFAVPFDLSRLETRGMPVPVLEDVAGNTGNAGGQLDFSQTGTMVYLSGESAGSGARRIVWMDSTGKVEPLKTTGAAFTPKLAPDGKLLAMSTGGGISIYDPQRGATTRLTLNAEQTSHPLWMPDGKHIVFSQESGDIGIWWVRADGSGRPEKLLGSKTPLIPTSLSPDGRRLAFDQPVAGSDLDIWTLPLDLGDRDHPKPGKPEPFLREPGDQIEGVISPDGRWMAYTSFQSGNAQVFVQPFPGSPSGGKWLISNAPARFPIWSRNGRELFYMSFLNQENHIMVVGYTAKGESFVADKPRQWSPAPIARTGTLIPLDLAPDGKRFVVFGVAAAEGQGGDKPSLHVTVLLNFFDELRRKVPPGGK